MQIPLIFLLAINISIQSNSINSVKQGRNRFYLIPYETLQNSSHQVRYWKGNSFVFLSYGGNWSEVYKRAAHECKVQNLLTPTWEDEDFPHPIESSATEWGWNLKPEGNTRRDCYKWVKQKYLKKISFRAHSNRPLKYDEKFYSLTGHSWFSVYGAQWGCDMIGLETGENIIAMQPQIAFLRGAARQNKKPFYVQVSQWYGGTIPVFFQGEDEFTPHELDKAEVLSGIASGGIAIPNGGHSSSLLARMWYVAFLSGAAVVCPENCQVNFFTGRPEENWDKPYDKRIPLSPIGKRAQDFMRVVSSHNSVGVPYIPFAIMLDEYCGFNGFPLTQPRPWNVLEPSWADREISLFFDTLFPKSMYLDFIPGVDEERENRRLVSSPYGDCFDVLLSNVSLEVLLDYPVLICLGEHEFLPETVEKIKLYLEKGGRLFLTYIQAEQLGEEIEKLKSAGEVNFFGLGSDDLPAEIDTVRWYTPAHWGADEETLVRRKEAVKLLPYEQKFKDSVIHLMSLLSEQYLPIRVSEEIEFLLNRTKHGWIIGLVNNDGITKGRMTPVKLEPEKLKKVRITIKCGTLSSVKKWCSNKELTTDGKEFSVFLPPGEVRIVELRLSR